MTKIRRVFLFCVVIFLAVVSFMIIKGGSFISFNNSSTLPYPSKEFEQWRQRWESQR